MDGKIALITGAANGIGFEIAKAMAENGKVVYLADLNKEQAEVKANELTQNSFSAFGIRCDVTKEHDLEATIKHIIDTHGRLDILVNNAGMQHISPIEEFPSDKFELLIKIMLTAPFYAIKHVFPIMKTQNYGRIINMSSINGIIGFAGKAAYNSAKHGIIGLTKVAALEGASHNITVNAVCPGYVDTKLVRNQLADLARNRNVSLENVLTDVIYPLVPQKRLIESAEIASYVLYLCSDCAKGVTGQAIVIDGGYTIQ